MNWGSKMMAWVDLCNLGREPSHLITKRLTFVTCRLSFGYLTLWAHLDKPSYCLMENQGLVELLQVIVWKWHLTQGRLALVWPTLTWSLEIISFLVTFTRFISSTAKAGKEIIERSPASISLDVDALGSMENRIDWMKNRGGFNLWCTNS